MSNFTPAQQKAIDCLDANMAVSAGAGAGKTKVLVQRYLNILLKTDTACDEILAITFTNKAATEMKQRIRNEVAALLQAGSSQEKDKWQELRYRLEFAPIGTIHSVCARILRENPVEAGLDPNFLVYDEAQTQLLMQTAIEKVIHKAARKDAEWLPQLLEVYGRSGLTENLLKIYNKLEAELENQDLLDKFLKPYLEAAESSKYIIEKLLADCQELIDFSTGLDKKSQHYKSVMAVCENWSLLEKTIKGSTDNDQGEPILDLYLGKLQARNKDKEIVKSIRKNLEALKGIKNERLAVELIQAVLQYFTLLYKELTDYRTQKQILTFGDLETLTLKLLENKNVCQQYSERFKYIMVDEVQDINDLQRQIIYLLCGGNKHKLLHNKLFIVGDAKQSIYRFRGADVDTFAKVTQDIINSGGSEVSLDINFRSTDKLLAAFNDIFAPLMSTDYDKVQFSALQAYRSAPKEGCIQLILLDKKELDEGQDGREQEARLIAQRIKQMVEQEQLMIDSQPVDFGQIAILFRSTTDIETYEAALQRAEVPYYVLGGRGFYQKQEIIDLLNLLRFIDNSHNELALAGILRSPLFLLSDDTLYWLKSHSGTLWQGIQSAETIAELNPEQQAAVQTAKMVLNYLYSLRGYVKVSKLLSLGVAKTQYDSFLLTQFMGLQKFANVKKLIEIAQEYEKQQFCNIHDFLGYIESLMMVEVREGEAQIESETGNTVKLMTIHKSKGLEFPVVFLPDLHRKFPQATDSLLYDAELGLGVKVRDTNEEWQKTAHYNVVAKKETLLSALELKRVLYVAMTRAKDYLVLSAVGDKINSREFHEDTNWLEWLGKICEFNVISDIPAVLKTGNTQIPVYQQNNTDELVMTENWYQQYRKNPLPEDSAVKNKVLNNTQIIRVQQPDSISIFSPTALNKYKRCPRAFFYQYIYGIPAIEENSLGCGDKAPAAVIGIAAHKACELVDQGMNLDESLKAAIKEVPAEWQDKVYAETRPFLKKYFSSDFYNSIKSCQALSEQKIRFKLKAETINLEFDFNGTIDRLNFYDDGTLGIVDYKTDAVDQAVLDIKQEEYLWQMMLYKLGAQIVFKKPVRDIALYFLRAETALTISKDNLNEENIKKDILETCQYITDHHQMNEYGCKTDSCNYCCYLSFCEKK